jgi:hypothetical protein
MTDSSSSPAPRYRVSYSERVRIDLRRLAAIAKQREMAKQFRDALQEIDDRLHVYPQFGEPLRDLTSESMHLYIGSVSPLVVKYVNDEERRIVIIGVPFLPLPKSGLD